MVSGGRVLVVSALLATVLSSLSVYPHQLAYFNKLSGGPGNGHRHLAGSNIGWSQDFVLLKEWIEAHPEARPLRLYSDAMYDPADLGLNVVNRRADESAGTSYQWYAVEISELQRRGLMGPVWGTEITDDGLRATLRTARPVDRIGHSIYIYRVDE